MPPQRSDLVLPTNIPYVEFDVLICDRFYVETDGRDGRDILVELELVKNGWMGVSNLSRAVEDVQSLGTY